jgi:hypothetical protein
METHNLWKNSTTYKTKTPFKLKIGIEQKATNSAFAAKPNQRLQVSQ